MGGEWKGCLWEDLQQRKEKGQNEKKEMKGKTGYGKFSEKKKKKGRTK